MMTTFRSVRPEPEEFNPFYSGYVSSVPDGDIVDFLSDQQSRMTQLLKGHSDERADFRYAEGKWSLKEVVGHMVDTEWVFSYRLLRFVRGDETALPGMDQDVFMDEKPFVNRSLSDLSLDFETVRSASLRLIGSLDQAGFGKAGIASDVRFSVRSLVWIIAGHCEHHMNVINERYL
ncbi:MAG: DinB family protein [Bacteroidetes Order II. Incertae sedis bacterium]|nr:DinB family protein [Bacteroidetes Order II. bacterium]MBT6201651.1 DinB family protein [Bacteroidetes Order II. bacterium]